jgi:aminoglycoside phosphotransferase (APT) family kinase protein
MASALPFDESGLTPAWMSSALGHRFPGVEVAEVREIGRSASTNLHLRLGLRYTHQAGAPDSLFAKLPPRDPTHRQAIGAAAMGAREANFYAHIAPSVSMRVPAAYFTAVEEDGPFLLLLEDLATDGFRISDGTWAVPGELAPRALEELAELHVAFEDPAVQRERAPWAAPAPPADRGPMLAKLREVITEHADELSEDYVAVGQLYLDHHVELERLWNEGQPTLTHGDPHIGNLFLDGDRVGFLDWGMTTIGSPLKDVSYLLTMGVEPEDRRRMQKDLLQHYLDVRRSLGGTPISFDDAWAAHRVLAGYNVLASFLGLTPPYNAPERHLFSSSFRERAMLSLEDLETVEAIRAVVG